MPSLPAKAAPLEKQIAVTALAGLSTALARALAETGLGGNQLEHLLAESIAAECLCCGITVSGPELMAAALGTEPTHPGTSLKLSRLRLGYCARKTCASSYYSVRLAARPDVDWETVWARLESSSVTPAPASPLAEPPRLAWRNLIPEHWLQYATRPLSIGLVSLLAVTVFLRSGCRVPGLSPKPRVFIVSDVVPTPAKAPLLER
jgi:hypothetical protein